MGCVNAYRWKLDAHAAQLLHTIMAGAIWTASTKQSKANVAEEAKCPYCGGRGCRLSHVVGVPSGHRSAERNHWCRDCTGVTHAPGGAEEHHRP